MQRWEYLTIFISGLLEFPEAVSEANALEWAGKSITQQLNEYASKNWQVIDMEWISPKEVMVTFQRPVQDEDE